MHERAKFQRNRRVPLFDLELYLSFAAIFLNVEVWEYALSIEVVVYYRFTKFGRNRRVPPFL